ncbi:MAG: hypothetical protein K6F17_06110 [Lachnospiraceae bacterium]|nr:hypothetical protein [Lachnospiraceae bacterium]
MEYGLTTNVQKKIKELELSKSQTDDYRFWWEVNLTKVENRNVLIIVHPSSRYSMIYSNLKPSIWKNLDVFLTGAIKDALLREGFSESDVKRYFEMSGDNIYTKTHGKVAIGGMNHIASMLWCVWHYYDSENMLQEHITYCANKELSTVGLHPEYNYIYPKELFVNEIKTLLQSKE